MHIKIKRKKKDYKGVLRESYIVLKTLGTERLSCWHMAALTGEICFKKFRETCAGECKSCRIKFIKKKNLLAIMSRL